MKVPESFARELKRIHPRLFAKWLPRRSRWLIAQSKDPELMQPGAFRFALNDLGGIPKIEPLNYPVLVVERKDGSFHPLDAEVITLLKEMFAPYNGPYEKPLGYEEKQRAMMTPEQRREYLHDAPEHRAGRQDMKYRLKNWAGIHQTFDMGG